MIKSIKQLREERIKEDTTKALLQAGRVPQPDEVSTLLARNLYSQDLSAPIYQYERVASNTGLSHAKYNKDIDNIEYDLSDLIEIMALYADKAEEVFNYFNIKKEQLEAQIAELTDRIDAIKLKAKYDIVKGTHIESFYNMDKISSQTTASIDLANHTATIPIVKGQDKILTLDESNTVLTVSSTRGVTITGDSAKTTESGSIYNILSPNATGWTYTLTSPIQASTEVVLNITINTDETINAITLRPLSVKPMRIVVQGFADEWTTIGSKQTNGSTALTYYSATPYKQFRVLFTKTEADKYSTVYSYIYGLESIVFQYQEYLEEALFVTNPIDVPEHATKFAVLADVDLPEGTGVAYFAKTSTDTIPIEISTEDEPVEYDIDNYSEELKSFVFPKTEAIENTRRIETAMGVPMFFLGNINNSVIPSSMILYRGVKCWRRAVISSNVMLSSSAFNNLEYTYLPYNRAFEIEAGYAASANTSLMYAATVVAAQQITFETNIRCNASYALYVNKTKIATGNATKKISFTLNEGENNVEIFVFTDVAKTIALSLDQTTSETMISKIYADSAAMTQAALNDIIYNKHPNDRSLYAISEISGNKAILLNSYDIGIQYDAEYKYIADDAEPYLDIRVKLTKDLDDVNNTPTLKQLKVRFV